MHIPGSSCSLPRRSVRGLEPNNFLVHNFLKETLTVRSKNAIDAPLQRPENAF